MFVQRFYDDRLAQAAYLIGCQQTEEAIVIDSPRDATAILAVAEREGFRITKVTETHIHADYVSGSRELAATTGATLLLSAEGGRDWQYAFAASDGATLLHDGDTIRLGGIRLDVRHTPGHTPEHLVFVVTDTVRSNEPVAMVSGDFIFVGDVGRPDLLEKAAKVQGTMVDSARQLFRSLKATADLPDHLQIWPGHGAGSACGKALGAMPSSTLGYERRTSWAFGIDDEDEFVRTVLDGQPTPPTYFARMKQVNRDGPTILGHRSALPQVGLGTVDEAIARGVVIDVRPGADYRLAHLPGTQSLPLIRAFTTWAGWLLDADQDVVVIAENEARATEARTALASIGIDRVTGWVDAAPIATTAGAIVSTVGDVTAAESMVAEGRTVIDLREFSEWSGGHIPGAVHHPLGQIETSLADLPRETPVAIHCQGGTRSGIGASVLERMGFTNILDLTGGYRGWQAAQGDEVD